MLLASGSHQAFIGCVYLMPNNWLRDFVKAAEAIKNTGMIYSFSERGDYLEHIFDEQTINGIRIKRANFRENRFYSKDFIFKAGLFREDFGLYSWEDCEYLDRVNRVSAEHGLINYILPDMGYAVRVEQKGDNPEYQKFRDSQTSDPRKPALYKKMYRLGNPFYNPYIRHEPNLLEEI